MANNIIILPQDNPQMRREWLKKARDAMGNAQLNCDPRQKEWQDMTEILELIEKAMGII